MFSSHNQLFFLCCFSSCYITLARVVLWGRGVLVELVESYRAYWHAVSLWRPAGFLEMGPLRGRRHELRAGGFHSKDAGCHPQTV